MKLYGFFRSSAAYRARIALNLKQIPYKSISLNLRKNEQQSADFLQLNPQGLVPVLEHNGTVLSQSLVIMEYLDQQFPNPALIPTEDSDRLYVNSIALTIACDIHPLNNLRILNYLEYNLAIDEPKRNAWYQHWVAEGLRALEEKLAFEQKHGEYCLANSPTLADVCLVPQMANARRFKCDLSNYPILTAIDAKCRELKSFVDAAPENQPDAL